MELFFFFFVFLYHTAGDRRHMNCCDILWEAWQGENELGWANHNICLQSLPPINPTLNMNEKLWSQKRKIQLLKPKEGDNWGEEIDGESIPLHC